MASKTVKLRLPEYDGASGLVLAILNEGGTSLVNGSGDTLTAGSYGIFSATVTEALYGWYDVLVLDGTTIVSWGKLRLIDVAGTYVVDSVSSAQYSPVVRSVDDTSVIPFFLDTPSLSLSGTKQINGGSSAAIEGAITYKYRRGDKYEYWLAYDADDRPTGEGFVQYAITDGTTTWQLSLVLNVSNSITVLPVVGTVLDSSIGTSIEAKVYEQKTVAVGLTDSNGNAVDLTGLTLELVFESGSTKVVIADGSIGRNSSTFWFTSTTELTSIERLWKWSLRVASTEQRLLSGTFEVSYDPVNV